MCWFGVMPSGLLRPVFVSCSRRWAVVVRLLAVLWRSDTKARNGVAAASPSIKLKSGVLLLIQSSVMRTYVKQAKLAGTLMDLQLVATHARINTRNKSLAIFSFILNLTGPTSLGYMHIYIYIYAICTRPTSYSICILHELLIVY